jgi:hypothetical protein
VKTHRHGVAWALLVLTAAAFAQSSGDETFQPVAELGYRVSPGFFHDSEHLNAGEASAVAFNSEGHIFLFQRVRPMLAEYDPNGNFLRSIGEGLFTHPHGLRIDRDDNLWTTDDGGYDRIIELDQHGKILGTIGEPGHAPGQLAWGHFLAVTPDRKILVADVLNWRFQVFVPAPPTNKFAAYVPSKRMFWDREQSSGWSTHTAVPKN